MTSGKNHDKSIIYLFLPFSIIVYTLFNDTALSIHGGISFLIGGLYLSPDLDTQSNCTQRWGIFKIIWLPYRKNITHRSLLSHSPIIGSSIRILYLMSPFLIFSWEQTLDFLDFLNINYRRELITSLISIEASNIIHLILDKDPIPTIIKKIPSYLKLK